MKKILIGTLALGMIAVTGCQKEDENYINICKEFEFTWNDVTNPATGKTWMDRNLGASRVALNKEDGLAFGDLYQWGRGSDGHECRYSNTTSTLSSTDTPEHGYFITEIYSSNSPRDWRETKNDSLWQGENGMNNPCPDGYRLPTKTEWEEEIKTWTDANPYYGSSSYGAYGSVLKLPMAGRREYDNGSIFNDIGGYWCSTVSGTNAYYFYCSDKNAFMYSFNRAVGLSVRCIKD